MDTQDDAYIRIRSEIVRLNRDWNTFHHLFAKDDQTVTLLHNTATGFFRIIKDVLTENIFMTICRLTDPPQSMGNDNLSLQRIIDDIHISKHYAIADDLQKQLDVIKEKSKPVRILRNQALSHLDFNRTLNIQYPDPIVIPRGLIDDLVNRINNMIKAIVSEFEGVDFFPDMVMFKGTAEDLIYFLEKGYKSTK